MISNDVSRDAHWYEALSLEERVELLRGCDPASLAPEDRERGERRLKRWREQNPFARDSALFARRLKCLAATEQEVVMALGAPPSLLQRLHRVPPEWLSNIERAFARVPARAEEHPSSGAPRDIHREDRALDGFMVVLRPFIEEARRGVQRAADDLASSMTEPPFDPATVVDALLSNFPQRVTQMFLERVLTLELNIARLEGRLRGDSPGERFDSFVRSLESPEGAISLLREYPVLARKVSTRFQQWADRSIAFLTRLCADIDSIRSIFSPQAPLGPLESVRSNVGDVHRGGQTVMIATFRGEGTTSLVYKPRSLAVDGHYQALLHWINTNADTPALRELKVLSRESYGWMEFVQRDACNTHAEVALFHQRQGMLLALLYVLQATDFHEENLIAAGDQPVLIDLESLLHPDKMLPGTRGVEFDAANMLMHSVLRVGLLPFRINVKEDHSGLQAGGLASSEGNLSAEKFPIREDAGSDVMRITRERVRLTIAHGNRPVLNGVTAQALDYTDDLLAGFSQLYDFLRKQKEALASTSGPLAPFAHDEVRAILRPTYVYGIMLSESFHPDFLRTGIEQSFHFDRLWTNAFDSKAVDRVLIAEQAALHRMDIPIFTSRPDSLSAWTDTDDEIPSFFVNGAEKLSMDRVDALSREDLQQQIWIIRASLSTLADRKTTLRKLPRATDVASKMERAALDRGLLIQDAAAIGDRLEALSFKDGSRITWLGLQPRSDDSLVLATAGISLFEGVGGPALFYAHLARHTGSDRYEALARLALATVRARIDSERANLEQIGAFMGWGGLVYTLGHLGVLWGDRELVADAEAMVSEIASRTANDRYFDIVGGAAGAILSLVPLYRVQKTKAILDTLIACGDALEAKCEKMARGIGWTAPSWRYPLAGFSHGNAGIALALLELFTLTGQDRFRALAMGALEYERSVYSEEYRTWPVLLRHTDPDARPPELTIAWCHGAAGVALSRARCLRHLDDPTIRAELEIAVDTTSKYGFGSSHSLCHGDFGNLDILREAAILPDSPWRETYERLAPAVHRTAREHGWVCGNPTGVETPGLMTGLAGIGYSLLRLADPQGVPSVLALDFPE